MSELSLASLGGLQCCVLGTLFQQEYFTCDWWFNVDCTVARKLWSLNLNLAAEREEYSSSV